MLFTQMLSYFTNFLQFGIEIELYDFGFQEILFGYLSSFINESKMIEEEKRSKSLSSADGIYVI